AEAAALVEKIRSNRMRFSRLKSILKQALSLLSGAAPLAVLVAGGLLALDGRASLGVVVAFATGTERLAGPIRDLIAFYRQSAQAVVQHVMLRRWFDGDAAARGA
ncbi:MAG: hypothetical protein AAFU61_15960, partial [Pseudomonadota bacterium]